MELVVICRQILKFRATFAWRRSYHVGTASWLNAQFLLNQYFATFPKNKFLAAATA